MPKSEFTSALVRTEGDLVVSGVVDLEGQPRPDGFMRVAWSVRQGWRFTGGIALVETDLSWSQIETVPGGWAASPKDDRFALSFFVEAFGTLVVEADGRRAPESGVSVAHPGAFVWSQIVPVFLESS